MSESKGPVRGFWNASLLVLGGCLLLWLAVQLIQSIWLWLAVGTVVVVVVWGFIVWLRWRQRRW